MRRCIVKPIVLLIIVCLSVLCAGCSSESEEAMNQKIETSLYTLTVPETWEDKYIVEITEHDYDLGHILFVSMKSNNELGQSLLFTLNVFNEEIALEDPSIVTSLSESPVEDPVGYILPNDSERYLVFEDFSVDPESNQCTAEEEAQYNEMLHECDSVIASLEPKDNVTYEPWTEEHYTAFEELIDDTPYVPVSVSYLWQDIQSYQNQTGEVLFSEAAPESIYMHGLRETDQVKYLVSTETNLLGVDLSTNEILAFSKSLPQDRVRDVLNSYGMAQMFDVTPKITPYDDGNKCLLTWKVDNGYFSIICVGSYDEETCYSAPALLLVLYTDINLCHIQ